jgi:Rad3-related DNA helicase
MWVDAVICDYNYVFDPQAFLRRHFADEGGDYAFLIDEAHNLVERARICFATAAKRAIQEVRAAIKDCARCARAEPARRVFVSFEQTYFLIGRWERTALGDTRRSGPGDEHDSFGESSHGTVPLCNATFPSIAPLLDEL